MFTVAIVDYHCYGTTFNGFQRYSKRCRYYNSQKCTKFQNMFCNCLLQSLKFVMFRTKNTGCVGETMHADLNEIKKQKGDTAALEKNY